MERDVSRRSKLSGCIMSPCCFSVEEEGYSRIHDNNSSSSRSRGWRRFLRKLVRDGKIMYGPKPLSFHYDAVSYSHNFDDGSHHHDSGHCPRQLFVDR